MKKSHFKSFLIVTVFLIIYSASSIEKNFFQVYETQAENAQMTKSVITFEDDHCIISYNFWAEGGDAGFFIKNKSSENIYVNLDKSFFILNGLTYDYYLNRIQGNSTNESISNNSSYYNGYRNSSYVKGLSSSNSISVADKSVLGVPPGYSRRIAEYFINRNLIRECGLPRYPSDKTLKTLNFTESNTPFTFSNIISYKYVNEEFNFENKFYVTSITNYPENLLLKEVYVEFCGKKTDEKQKVFERSDANMFYIKYSQ